MDDELPGLTYLKMLCEQIQEIEVVKSFIDPETFLMEFEKTPVDFCILDIEMPKLNGLEVAKRLNKPVIFTTAYKDFALDAFEVSAVDYVLKPVKLERLQLAIEKIKQVLPVVEEKKYVQLNSDKGKSIIYFDKITYIATSEIDSRDKILWFEDGSKLKLKNISFDKLQVSLPFGQFVRVNKKELLSMRCIHSFSSYEIKTSILLQTGKNLTLNLSEIYKEEFIKKVTLA